MISLEEVGKLATRFGSRAWRDNPGKGRKKLMAVCGFKERATVIKGCGGKSGREEA